MFGSSVVDKENIQGEALALTPTRRPLKTVQIISQNGRLEGTPSGLSRKTPKNKLSNITPSSRNSSRRLSKRRQSVPLRLPKSVSIFDEETFARTIDDIPGNIMGKISNCEEQTGSHESQELNEMLRKKVFETVTKMSERYEVCLAEKEHDLKEKTCIIEQLKTEMIILKQDKGTTKTPDKLQNLCEEEQVSLFVQHVLSGAMKDMERPNSVFELGTNYNNDPMVSDRDMDSMVFISPNKQINLETSVDLSRQEKSEPVKQMITCEIGTCMTPVKQVDALTVMTPTKQASSMISMSPLRQVNSQTGMTPVHTQETSSGPCNTPITCPNVSTTMTPIEHVSQDTMVSPIKTHDTAVITSPLVAVLQPEMISQLPLETLRSELESAAISNELLRCECDDLNRRIEELESCLKEVKNSASKKCGYFQERVNQLEKELEEASEINYKMEQKKPHSVEEYEDVIQRLQKDILLKEKQIAFYAKKASEADNLQKDLRRMYAKYNAEHESYTELDQRMKSLADEHNVKCEELETIQEKLANLRIELGDAKATIDVQENVRQEAKNNQVKCCNLEEQIETFQCQQKEDVEFLEQERKGLEETNVELERMVHERSAELDVTRQGLDEKTEQYEHLRETAHSLRTQLSEVQDELNAVQSQAYLVMLEQEKELTTVTRVLEEAWERLRVMVDTVKEQALCSEEVKVCTSGDEIMKDQNGCDSTVTFKPSLVFSVLAAVSGTAAPGVPVVAENSLIQEEKQPEEQSNSFVADSPAPSGGLRHDPRHFTLVDRAKSLGDLLHELEDHTCGPIAKEQTKKHMDEITSLENTLLETRQQYERKINGLKQELASGCEVVKEVQRVNDHKQIEIESLKLELHTTDENFQTSRERVRELSERYCELIEQETKNEDLNENLHNVQRECERLKKEKSSLEKELNETMERLHKTVELTNEEPDVERRKTHVQESFTELLQEKLKLQREVEKLKDSYSKSRMEKETFTRHTVKLDTKARILANNLVKAEEEIYRLDGIIDRFCCVAQKNREMAAHNKELCDLLKELNINIEVTPKKCFL